MPVFTFETCCFPSWKKAKATTSLADSSTNLLPAELPLDGSNTNTDNESEDGESKNGESKNGESENGKSEEELRNKAALVAAEYFARPISAIATESMQGGAFNEVVGVTVSATAPKFSLKRLFAQLCQTRKDKHEQHKSYIVRIPRDEDPDIDRYLAILKAVGSRLALPIPEVVTYDLSSDNVLGKPYMIQKRLPGQNLGALWNELNPHQMKSIAKRIPNLISDIAAISGAPGNLALSNLLMPTTGDLSVDKFCIPLRDCEPALPQTPFEHLLEQCQRWREFENTQKATFNEVWDGFSAMIKSLNTRGFLNGPCVLVHGDLKPHNLLGEFISPTELSITGVIDWDMAIIAPEFMAYRAPFWSWIPEDMDSAIENDEENANCEPETDLDREMKDIFLANASEKYKFYAFAPEAVLARRMFPILVRGLTCDWDHDESEAIVRAWDKLHPEDGVLAAFLASKINFDVDSDSDDASEDGSDSESDDDEE